MIAPSPLPLSYSPSFPIFGPNSVFGLCTWGSGKNWRFEKKMESRGVSVRLDLWPGGGVMM